ncbi:MAG: hypothetical protein AAFX54_16570 [Pseudomonadota bacterium]
MIIVSSLDHAVEAFRKHRPAYVVSILDVDEPTPPAFDTLPSENHIKLIGDCSRGGADCDGQSARCNEILDIARRWVQDGRKSPILIHCNEGAARSMAVAYIMMCAIEPAQSEKDIAARLRSAAPHADPNLLLISEADAALGRNDRMIEAILDLCPCCSTVGAPIVTLPLAA